MEPWVLRSGKYTRRVLRHSRVLDSRDSAIPYAPRIRTVLSETGRPLLDMGTLRPRLDVRAVAPEQLSTVRKVDTPRRRMVHCGY
jgi:hypothetical protein